jgi:ABC-2 type transport system permease protein
VNADARMVTAPPGDTAIHDLGYRRYDGTRVGARGAWLALYWQGVRTMFGLGRAIKSKLLPAFVLAATLLPALATLAASSASQGMVPVRYGPLITGQLILFVLFVAAQAPELLSRDQQHRVLPLILTREVTRTSYATARWAAMTTALFAVALAPLLLLYVGEIGVAKDPAAAFEKVGTRIGPVFVQAALTAIALSGVGAALAAWTSRRAYATAAIIGVLLTATGIATGLDGLAGVSPRVSEFVDPIHTLRTLGFILFGETTRSMELDPPASVWVYAGALGALGAAGAAILQWRVRRLVP